MFYARQTRPFLTSKPKIVAIVLFGTLLGQLAIDLYLPALPTMAALFSTTQRMMQLSLSIYLLGYGVTQLLFGYLTERWGRRPSLLIGYTLFFFATLAILQWQNSYLLLCWRFTQGMGSAAAVVGMRCVLRDLYTDKGLAKVISYTAALWGLMPIIAPIIGAYLLHYLGWQANFHVLLFGAGLVLILSWRLLPETQTEDSRTRVSLWVMIKHHATDAQLWRLSMATLSSTGLLFAWVTASPFLLMQHFGVTPVKFGWLMFLLACANLTGALLNARLLHRTSQRVILRWGISLITFASMALLVCAYQTTPSLWAIIISLLLLLLGEGLCYANLASLSLAQCDQFSGMGAAWFGSLLAGGVAGVSFLVAHLPSQQPQVIAWVLLVLTIALISFASWAKTL